MANSIVDNPWVIDTTEASPAVGVGLKGGKLTGAVWTSTDGKLLTAGDDLVIRHFRDGKQEGVILNVRVQGTPDLIDLGSFLKDFIFSHDLSITIDDGILYLYHA